jgi:hypothetical protein
VEDVAITIGLERTVGRQWARPGRAEEVQESIDESRIGDVDVGAVSYRFFQSIREVPERVECPLHRDRQTGSEGGDVYDDVNVLGLQSSEYCGFAASA